MRNILIAGFIFFITSTGFTQTQMEMNEQAKNSFQQADKELNKVYQQILKDYSTDTLFLKNLKASQKIWIQFRDAEMKMKYPLKETEYYSMQTVCWYNYMQNITEARTLTLKDWLKPLDDGDVCAGSIMAR